MSGRGVAFLHLLGPPSTDLFMGFFSEKPVVVGLVVGALVANS